MTELQTLLTKPDGERELADWFAQALRAGHADQLNEFLEAEFRAHPDSVSQLCLSIPASAVSIVGWQRMYVDLSELDRRDAAGRPITAIGIDLSAHCDPGDDAWELETNFYDDKEFRFSADNLAAINHAAATGETPWQGNFRDLTHSLSVRGLSELYRRLSRLPRPKFAIGGQPVSAAMVAAQLGWLFVTLRFHQALRSAISLQGMPRKMVVLGGAHDIPPYIEVAYWCDTVAADPKPDSALLATVEEERKARVRRMAEAEVQKWRECRDTMLRNDFQPKDRAECVRLYESRDRILRQTFDLGKGPPVHKLDNYHFELLLHGVRCHYAKKIDDPLPEPPPPPPRRSGLLGLLGLRS